MGEGGGAGQQSKDLTKYSNDYDSETRNMSACEKVQTFFFQSLTSARNIFGDV